jgi:CRISPR-associated protein Csx16
MRRYFVSRHPGAIAWAQQQALHIDTFIPHLDPSMVRSGDVVMGTLPIPLAAEVCASKAQYLHLNLQLPYQLRGQELSVEKLCTLQATLRPYCVVPMTETPME